MLPISIIGTSISDLDLSSSRIEDLIFVDGWLFSTTRFDGQIVSWHIDPLVEVDVTEYVGTNFSTVPHFVMVNEKLMSGGWTDDELALHDIGPSGEITSSTSLGLGAGLDIKTALEVGRVTFVYGIATSGSGISYFSVDSRNTASVLKNSGTPNSVDVITADLIADRHYLFTASQESNTVQSWLIGSSGALTMIDSLSSEDGLWISQPTALATAKTADGAYLIVASASSSTLSTMQIESDGSLTLREHLLDDKTTRFAGVTTIEVIEHDGASYVIAGGRDDGATVLRLLPGGRLQSMATIADTTEAALSNPSSFAAKSDGNGISIFAASSTEAGLTELNLDTANLGQVFKGTTTNDTHTGTLGDDIFMDSDGIDTFASNDGSNLFILSTDEETDFITGFQAGLDQVDLSSWPGLRSTQQLHLSPTATGLIITYGDEVLEIRSKNGEPIDKAHFLDLSLVLSTRLGPDLTTGTSGPGTTIPDLPDRDPYVPPTPDDPEEEDGIERIGVASAEALTGTEFDDQIWGLGGNDTITGYGGNDMLFGGSGGDKILGGDGDDFISGGNGRNEGWLLYETTISNADVLIGGLGNDLLQGFAGADTLDGGAGSDRLIGGGGRDTFVFSGGTDHIADFQFGVDRLELASTLWAGSQSVSNIVNTYGSSQNSTIVLDFGTDTLTLENLTNLSLLTYHIDIA